MLHLCSLIRSGVTVDSNLTWTLPEHHCRSSGATNLEAEQEPRSKLWESIDGERRQQQERNGGYDGEEVGFLCRIIMGCQSMSTMGKTDPNR